ncbi:MAG: DUF128 domain-containing protein [Candidatus Bathyarchaeota archaeon]|nr:MAG: DUF128 domain-containing protein [Candidatus Bathyarchaeota archaeon]
MTAKEKSRHLLSVENDSSRKEIEILRVLSEHDRPVGSTLIAQVLGKKGFLLSERTVRYHLQLLELKGLAKGHNRSGRTITPLGLRELANTMVFQRMGFVTTRFLSLAYEVTYQPDTSRGEVVANVSIINKDFHDKTLEIIESLHEKGFLTAPYIKVLDETEEYKDIYVPKGKIALFTVCNLAIDGVFLNLGIPILFKYGGPVQFVDNQPVRFVDLISYEGTTIPPLEVFVYRNATSILSVLRTGSGLIPANLREIPAAAEEKAEKILADLRKKEWHGILKFGKPNESILGVPVAMDRIGISMIGGLTPAAALREIGAKIDTFAPHCLMPVEDMTQV